MAGIDGTVSTAIGAALAHAGRTIALLGDLTFVHDASGLLIGPTEPTPRDLTIVVSNDNGGGIFELLEQGDPRFSDVSSRIFGTPHDVDVGRCAGPTTSRRARSRSATFRASSTNRTPACRCWRSRPTGRRCGSCMPPSGLACDRSVAGPAEARAALRDPELPDTARRKALRWAKTAVWILAGVVTLQSILLVAGAWRNDRQIESHMGVAEAQVLSAGPRRSTIEFVTPPTVSPTVLNSACCTLGTGHRDAHLRRIRRHRPGSVRVQNRNASLAIILAASVAVLGWLIGCSGSGRARVAGETAGAADTWLKRKVHL